MENDFAISRALIRWYDEHKRALPWRQTADPYIIWISEIILQQTRVAQGLDYFLRFVKRFPNVRALALAPENDVLKHWQGLGYYSRARNLHAAARAVMEKFDGIFPSEYHHILSLPGVGEYTAAAIVSFAWNQPRPVVDGNVYRVLARLFALNTPIDSTKGKKEFLFLAQTLMDPYRAGEHNQAMMEFGALQCVPKNPDCDRCPLSHKCAAFAGQNVQHYPVKQKKVPTKPRYFHYLHVECRGQTFLHHRTKGDIWTGLYEFPLIETLRSMDYPELVRTEAFDRLLRDTGTTVVDPNCFTARHVLSHQTLYAVFHRIKTERSNDALNAFLAVPVETIGDYAVPRLIHLYLEKSYGKLLV